MSLYTDTYGYEAHKLLTSPEDVYDRLRDILTNKVLRFNPYTITDKELLACVERARWQPFPAITQMVVFHFHDIRKVVYGRPYDAIFLHIGNDPNETHLPINLLTQSVIYNATRRQIKTLIDGKKLTHQNLISTLVNKDYFVSHALMSSRNNGRKVAAYRMYALIGSDARRAAMIRARMVESKIAMLEEVIHYPYSSDYLQCSRQFIDYETPIRATIEAIRHFPEYSHHNASIDRS